VSYFALEASDTSRTPALSGGATGPVYTQPSSATSAPASPPAAPAPAPARPDVTRWVNSPEARQYEGRWVLLSEELDVIDHDTSPTALLMRNPTITAPIVVYVDRRDVGLAV
jgi:hypothetical protein